ncbi:MAG: UpxY family transcription antiterminator [candidate division WOR-3 bacterium]
MQWFAVYTLNRHERRVEQQLRSIGVDTFLPEINVVSGRWDRHKIIQKPLFPGYLFVNIIPEPQAFLKILKRPSVCYILGINGQPIPIPSEEIESIKILLANNRDLCHYPFLKKGDRVRVVSGALKGAVGFLISNTSKKRRLVVSIELMRRSVVAELFEEEVEPY